MMDDIKNYVDEEHMQLSRMGTDSMDDDELKEWHLKICAKQPDSIGWDHAFHFYNYVEDDGQTLCSIADPKHRVVRLFTKEHWQKMGTTINEDEQWRTDLGLIDLRDCSLNSEDVEMIFGCGRTCTFPLRRLYLNKNRLGARGVASLVPFLKSMKKLIVLNLLGTNLGINGARHLSEVLDHICIETLSVQNNIIGSKGVESILSAQNAHLLVELYIHHNKCADKRGFDAISNFLSRDDIALRLLSIQCDQGRHAKMIIDSISKQSKLEELHFYNGKCEGVMPKKAVSSLQNLICNRSSFESLCQSSHHLISFGKLHYENVRNIWEKHNILNEALRINGRVKRGVSIGRIMRSKLRSFYFNQYYQIEERSSFDVRPFQEMDVVLMPFALELVTRVEGSRNAPGHYGIFYDLSFGYLSDIYRMIRNCHLPELLSFPSPETKMRQLEARIAALEAENSRIAALEAENSQRKRDLEELSKENKQLRAAISVMPNKRAK